MTLLQQINQCQDRAKYAKELDPNIDCIWYVLINIDPDQLKERAKELKSRISKSSISDGDKMSLFAQVHDTHNFDCVIFAHSIPVPYEDSALNFNIKNEQQQIQDFKGVTDPELIEENTQPSKEMLIDSALDDEPSTEDIEELYGRDDSKESRYHK